MSLAVAYFTPLPPQRSGIADYSAMLLPALAAGAHITVFIDDVHCLERAYSGVQAVLPMDQYPARRREFDLVIYQMGNSHYHETLYHYLKRYPGLTVLHDYYLHHFVASITAWRGDFGGYAREMAYARGEEGLRRARAIQAGQTDYPLYEWPLNDRVLDSSLGLIVHSSFVARQLRAQRPCLPVAVVPQVMQLPVDRLEPPRLQLDLPSDAFVIGCAGLITPEKRVELVLRAFARLLPQTPRARLLIVGEIPDWYPESLPNLIAQLGLSGVVTCTGHVASLQEFDQYLSTFDVGINLRWPTSGETSASALRMMAHGCPVIVTNTGWYAELPADLCLRLDHSPDEEERLLQHLLMLAGDQPQRQRLGQRAREYIQRECAPDQVARRYLSFASQLTHSANS